MLRKLVVLALGALLCAVLIPSNAGPAAAEETTASVGGEIQTNVRVTIRLGKIEMGKRTIVKAYQLVVAAGSAGSRLLSGSRVPIPTTAAEEGEISTQYVYQNIGFSTFANVSIVGGGKVKLFAEIEDSRLKESGSGAPPVVETRQLSVDAILDDDKPIEVTRVEGEADQGGFVEVQAEILR